MLDGPCSRGSPCPPGRRTLRGRRLCTRSCGWHRRCLLRYGSIRGGHLNWTGSPPRRVSYSELSSPLNMPMAHPPVAAPKPQRGRPRDPERVRRILEAAQTHFNEHGLERASVDAIAADAGVSKMTVYSNFGSKEGLFQAVVRDRTAAVMAGFPGAGALDPGQPEKVLLAIGARFLALVRGDALGALRAVYGVAGAQP